MTTFWVVALALTIVLYVLLDGFDLGVGILFLFNPSQADRRQMLAAISPVWDGNETWLVLTGTILFGAFSRVFALVLSALYLPVLIGICALILRGVAFEFRHNAKGSRALWDIAFSLGSFIAAFVQGAALGTLAQGLPIHHGQFIGGALFWASPFPLLCGLGLGGLYALLGCGWLIMKCSDPLHARYSRLMPVLLGIVAVLGVLTVAYAMITHVVIAERWHAHPALYVIPVLCLLAGLAGLGGLHKRNHSLPFLSLTLLIGLIFAGVALSFWPYMVPYSITISAAASPSLSTRFLFWGAGLVALPLTLLYTIVVYRVFRGKVADQG